MNISEKDTHFSYLKFFFSVLRFRMFFSVALNILIGLLDGIGLTLLIPLLHAVGGGTDAKKSIGQMQHFINFIEYLGITLTVNVVFLIFICIFILKALVKYIAARYQNKVQLFFVKKVQMQLLSNLKQMSYRGYLQLDAGNIQNTIIGEVWRVSTAMKSYLRWSQSFFMLMTYVFLAFLANPQFALLITVSASLSNLFYRQLFKKIKAASYEISKKGQNLNGYMIELVHYFKYLKSTNYLNQFSGKIKGIIIDTQNISSKQAKYSAIIGSLKEPIVVTIVVAVMFVQINWMGGGIGSIILSLLLFYRGLNSMLSIQNDWQSFLQNSGAFRMVSEVARKMESLREPTGSTPFRSIEKEIRLENVSLSFGKNKVLKDVNIQIPKNTTIALTGVSGSGKTTLVNIISGLLKPDKGSVVVDERLLDDYKLDQYRSRIGYISQESVIFNDTLFNNITFWAKPTPENKKRFWDVVAMASLTEFIEGQEAKEDTHLGDNGILISGGQRQRISIARELYKNPEILILDEATSALDSETERIIQDNIVRLHGQYTMVIIAHRLSTIKHVDEIYLLEKGQIVHSGRFDEMVENSTKFRNLVSLQGL